MTETRPYRKRKRAESENETHRRIVEATVELHEEIGPRATTISAIAKRAGVQRLTVYRHFPDETAIFRACTSHWLAENPLPDSDAWQGIEDPLERVRAALAQFYRYYRRTERMWTATYRDGPSTPALEQPIADVARHIDRMAARLEAAFPDTAAKQGGRKTTIRHALSFATWQDLAAQGLADKDIAALACRWIKAAE